MIKRSYEMSLDREVQKDSATTDPRAIWQSITSALQQAAEDVVFNDPRVESSDLQTAGLRYLTRMFSLSSLAEMESCDSAWPEFVQIVSPKVNTYMPNPDDYYLYAAIDAPYTYR